MKLPKSHYRNRDLESVIRDKLVKAASDLIKKQGLTHFEVAKKSGLPRSAVTGILSGSLKSVTIDRILRLVESLGLSVTIKIAKSSRR